MIPRARISRQLAELRRKLAGDDVAAERRKLRTAHRPPPALLALIDVESGAVEPIGTRLFVNRNRTDHSLRTPIPQAGKRDSGSTFLNERRGPSPRRLACVVFRATRTACSNGVLREQVDAIFSLVNN